MKFFYETSVRGIAEKVKAQELLKCPGGFSDFLLEQEDLSDLREKFMWYYLFNWFRHLLILFFQIDQLLNVQSNKYEL
ncbi:MAG: hypothetical protein H0S84_07050 [Bacteroidales bacterium]|nr:hypothetical protein [Bacteroidales bacterium]